MTTIFIIIANFAGSFSLIFYTHFSMFFKMRRSGLTMHGIYSFKQWCNLVSKSLINWEELFSKAKSTMKSAMWYNTPFNSKRRILPYINGSNEAKTFFELKSGCWVLKWNVEIIGSLTSGSKEKCLERGKMLLKLHKVVDPEEVSKWMGVI